MRGQAHTLEAFLASLLLISGLIFALGATAVTPLSASTSNQHIQNQQQLLASDILSVSANNGSLQHALLEWNASAEGFAGTSDLGYFTQNGPPNQFGETLNTTFRDERIAFNVMIVVEDANGGDSIQHLVFMGSPSDNAVVESREITLFNDTELTGPQSLTLEETLTDEDFEFYAPDAHKSSSLYNVMEVRLVVWRM